MIKRHITITGTFNSYSAAAKALNLRSHHRVIKASNFHEQINGFDIATHTIQTKHTIFSPRMHHQDLSSFYNKPTTYILYFKHNGQTKLKFGSTKDFKKRFQEHTRNLPNPKIWAIFACRSLDHALESEQSFKVNMKAYIKPIIIGRKKKKQTEILSNVSPERAEFVMSDIVRYEDTSSIQKSIELVKLEIRRLELVLGQQKLDPEIHFANMIR